MAISSSTMIPQLLPDDILALILEEHLIPSTGYNAAQRLQTIKDFSLSSRTLALACRRLIFERTRVLVGGDPKPSEALNVESQAEGLKDLFQVNPSYNGFVKSLRIECGLSCSLVGDSSVSDVTSNSADIDHSSPCLHEASSSPTVSIHYTSTPSGEAAICWLLSQHYLNLNSFHFIVRQPSTDEQVTLWKAAQLEGTIPSLALTAAGTTFPDAIIRFLSAGNQPLEHLTLSSNLPTRILRYFNGARPLKLLSLIHSSEVESVRRTKVEAPFRLGDGDPRTDASRIEVEDLCCDMTGRNTLRWLYGPDCSVDLGNLKTLRLSSSDEGRPFPLALCRTSLTTLDLLYSSE